MKKSIACIVYNQEKNKIFIAKRMPIGRMGGKWEFPGGKLEADEDAETAIIREMQEEFSVNVSVGTKVGETTFFHFDDQVLLEAYEVSFEHDGIEKKFKLHKIEAMQKFLEIIKNSNYYNEWLIFDIANVLEINKEELLNKKEMQIHIIKNM